MNIARIHLKISEHMSKSELYFSYPYGIFLRIREFQGKSEALPQPPPPPSPPGYAYVLQMTFSVAGRKYQSPV